jgi:glycosyltransferase involved in cell wall biosynthesis
MNPLVSIIVPYYNHGEYIEESIESVLNTKYPNLEIILINDSSTDQKSIDIFNLLNSPLITKYTIPNGGPCSAKNFGVSKASGEIIGFLDSDNMYLTDYILEATETIIQNNIDWVFSDCIYFGDKQGVRKQILKEKAEIFINSPIDNCFFIKTKTFKSIGGFDENLNRLGLEDWELTVRLIMNDIPYLHIDKPLFKYRVIDTSRSSNEARDNKENIIKYVFKKHHKYLFEMYSEMFFENLKMKESFECRIANKLRKLINR